MGRLQTKLKRQVRKLRRRVWTAQGAVVALLLVVAGGLLIAGMTTMRTIYADELLNTIAVAESNGNYNAYFGNSTNDQVLFTEMSVTEVVEWQDQFVAAGNASSAVGRYQFINTTLRSLIDQLGVDSQTTFDAELQDTLAEALLARRGVHEYLDGRLTRDEFAFNLSKEWAGLPKTIGENPETSYYAGDGLNEARATVDQLRAAIETVKEI